MARRAGRPSLGMPEAGYETRPDLLGGATLLGRDDLADHPLMPGAAELRRALRRSEPDGRHVAVVHRTGADVEAGDREVVVLLAVVADLERHRRARRDPQDRRLEPGVLHDDPDRARPGS